MTGFKYKPGTLIMLRYVASFIDDIIDIKIADDCDAKVIIICGDGYDKDIIKKFVRNNIPLGIDYELKIDLGDGQ